MNFVDCTEHPAGRDADDTEPSAASSGAAAVGSGGSGCHLRNNNKHALYSPPPSHPRPRRAQRLPSPPHRPRHLRRPSLVSSNPHVAPDSPHHVPCVHHRGRACGDPLGPRPNRLYCCAQCHPHLWYLVFWIEEGRHWLGECYSGVSSSSGGSLSQGFRQPCEHDVHLPISNGCVVRLVSTVLFYTPSHNSSLNYSSTAPTMDGMRSLVIGSTAMVSDSPLLPTSCAPHIARSFCDAYSGFGLYVCTTTACALGCRPR